MKFLVNTIWYARTHELGTNLRKAELLAVIVESAEQVEFLIIIDLLSQLIEELSILCLVGNMQYFTIELEAVTICWFSEFFHYVKHIEIVIARKNFLIS